MGPKKHTPDFTEVYKLIADVKKDLATKATAAGFEEILSLIQENKVQLEPYTL